MLKKIQLIILISIMLIPFGLSNERINTAEYLEISFQNEITLDIDLEPDYKIKKLDLYNNILPPNYNNIQSIQSKDISHSPYEIIRQGNSEKIKYDLSNNVERNNLIENEFIVRSSFNRPRVYEQKDFPLKEKVDSKYEKYLEFSGLVTTDSNIRSKASSIAHGEEDLFVVATKLANWVRNEVEYDLSTVTQNPNQNASEVFISREGVCQEVTILYASMMRSLGVPTRVVTGYSHSTSEEIEAFIGDTWAGHAWAEVLIDGNWVPFDLTYDQYGYVDASHIVFDSNQDIESDSLKLDGTGIGIGQTELDSKIDVELLEKSSLDFKQDINLDVETQDAISFNSKGYLNITLENNRNFYQVIHFAIGATQETELKKNKHQIRTLKPEESKEIIVPFDVSADNFEEGHIYTLPFIIQTQNLEKETEVLIQENAKEVTDIPSISDKMVSEIDIRCSGKFSKENNIVNCKLKNLLEEKIEDAEICIDECVNIDIENEKEVELKTQSFSPRVEVETNGKSTYQHIFINKPEIKSDYSITGYNLNTSIGHNSNYDLDLIIKKNGEEIFNEVGNSKKIEIDTQPGEHTLEYIVKNNNKILSSKTKTITVEEISIIERILLFFRNLF